MKFRGKPKKKALSPLKHTQDVLIDIQEPCSRAPYGQYLTRPLGPSCNGSQRFAAPSWPGGLSTSMTSVRAGSLHVCSLSLGTSQIQKESFPRVIKLYRSDEGFP
ncbi:hypothetical protein BDV26DRAFT_256119 [Aspergillus bertholletiae]|uniref:Uncharacterized protein n=1 Tax=Aspergillus bertholletiae TaxID=1226010 RepID=A0A5N7BH56_9EURO|nr:hypothetical protein BDV26DRAFT_256119 [Aspergillus bertholletiae]